MNTVSIWRACTASLAIALATGQSFGAQTPVLAKATITIDAAKTLGRVNRLVFGDNIEAADSKHVYGEQTYLGPLHTGTGFWDDKALQPDPYVVARMREIGLSALRYPGGSLANMYDWKKAVGPLSERGEWHFGIDEYIATCRAIGAEPQFIVSDYTGTPKEAGELVEYLNAPASPKHPWAMLRAKCGHTPPYRVHLFELGNETDCGGGYPRRTFSAEEYSAYANTTIAAMRAVDPGVRIGIIAATGKPVDDPWNSIVFRQASKNADFIVIHRYAVGQDTTSPEDRIMRGCMASADQYEAMFAAYHGLIRSSIGHDLPLALTEYNGGFDEPNPPYRFSLGAALFSADLIRVLLKPSSNILLANYWQAVNGYWGMLRGSGDNWKTMPAYPLRRLWGQHFGQTLVPCDVQSPVADFEGVQYAKPATGKRYIPSVRLPGNLLDVESLDTNQLASFGARRDANVLVYDLKNVKQNLYPGLATIPMPQSALGTGANFALSYDIRVTPTGAGQGMVSLGLGDSRGWDATHSAAKIGGAVCDGAWHHCEGKYISRPDATSVSALIRVEDPNSAINARVEIKNISLTASTGEIFPAYALVTASASSSARGDTVFVIAFNKSSTTDIPVEINLHGAHIVTAKRWTVTGPSLGATNMQAEVVTEAETNAETMVSKGVVNQVLPAHSMTAFELHVTAVH
ncbi:MAG: alpha-L-arabinofuranosidase C-terminal domain-containing protein [Capsulimonadaceae bacterium]|nr:alpha-L-arabinofuranosidase C-terminal domain-containing protein [Capsulimonadaceae bacterium]